MAKAVTGSGKTLAYALPISFILREMNPKVNRNDGTYALVLIPTRELGIFLSLYFYFYFIHLFLKLRILLYSLPFPFPQECKSGKFSALFCSILHMWLCRVCVVERRRRARRRG